MLRIEDMPQVEMRALLARSAFGHLGCTRDGQPYVVPMNYAYDGEALYFFTTEGTKTEFIAANRKVCFQVEEVTDPEHWCSVMLMGEAQRLTKPAETEPALRLLTARNPTLTPALNKTEIGPWHRLTQIAIYRIRPSALYGRRTADGPQ